ncbi:hypothetical protein WD019_02550 [Fictibacillus sp. Mic-4]|uniref:hypothetical protein n=1 Tax=Fictibacillus sp. Mic-4 TaxID=3132826 RepID=UPI003CF5C749
MKLLKTVICLLIFLGFHTNANARQPGVPTVVVDTKPMANLKELRNESTIIAFGWFNTAHLERSLGKSVQGGKLVNFVQSFQTKRYIKGSGPQIISVVSTGIDPLPAPENPLNKVYPGPMAEGEYIAFLKPLKGTKQYILVGGWQGVYPIIGGKTIALEGSGFNELNALTVQEFETKIKTSF